MLGSAGRKQIAVMLAATSNEGELVEARRDQAGRLSRALGGERLVAAPGAVLGQVQTAQAQRSATSCS